MKVIAAEVRIATLSDYLQLTKPRITTLVVATTMIGFCLASKSPIAFVQLFHTLLGTALAASGASALNMVLEWDADARMRRTERRPIPSGRLTVPQALAFGGGISTFGIVYLWFLVNPLTSLLAMITVGLYLFAYTPLKKRTWLCTAVGAVPGAIPPMMGWTGATNSLQLQAWWLFAILFFWQLPHFLAIAWLYREDYAQGGFAVLPVIDREGSRTSRQIILHTAALLLVTLLPAILGHYSRIYLLAAFLLGSFFLWMGMRLANTKSRTSARQLLLASVIYLPLLLSFLMIGRAS